MKECTWWNGKLKTWWRKRWSRALPFPMHLHISSLSTWQPPSCAQILWYCQPQRNERFPTCRFLRSTAVNCDLSTAVSEYSSAFGSLSALSCLRSFISNSAAWELKHILDINLIQIWWSFSLNFTVEHKNVPISCCLGNHQCHWLLLIRGPAVFTDSGFLHITPCQHKLNCERARHLHCNAQELWQFSPWTSETIMHESAK